MSAKQSAVKGILKSLRSFCDRSVFRSGRWALANGEFLEGRGAMIYWRIAFVLGITACLASPLLAQENHKPNLTSPAITAVGAGQETFRAYCASCHGLDAKGTGPVAAALKYKPSDLTQLSKGNGGKFPSAVVEDALQSDPLIPAHGSRETPIWSDAFRNTNRDETLVRIKIHNVVLYIESIQEK